MKNVALSITRRVQLYNELSDEKQKWTALKSNYNIMKAYTEKHVKNSNDKREWSKAICDQAQKIADSENRIKTLETFLYN